MAEIYDYDTSASNNNDAPPNGFPEGMQYSQVNDSARELMAGVARYVHALSGVGTTGSNNGYALAVEQTITAYATGMLFVFAAHEANTGAATLNINGVGSRSILSSEGRALTAGALVANGRYLVQFDGNNFRLLGYAPQLPVSSVVTSGVSFLDAQVTVMTLPLEPSTRYRLEGVLFLSSGGARDSELELELAGLSGNGIFQTYFHVGQSTLADVGILNTNTAVNLGNAGNGASLVKFEGVYTTSAAGNLLIRLNRESGGGLTHTLFANSFAVATPLQ